MKKQFYYYLVVALCWLVASPKALAVKPVDARLYEIENQQKKKKKPHLMIRLAERFYKKQIDQMIERHVLMSDTTRCDTLILRNGKKIAANVLKVDDDGVRYRRCGAINTPFVTVSNAAIQSIKYDDNGEEDETENLVLIDCDVITLRNGKEIEADIINISDDGIKYRKCKSSEDKQPLLLANAAVKRIRYKNGKEDNLEDLGLSKEYDPIPDEFAKVSKREMTNAKLIGFIVGLVPFLGVLITFLAYLDRNKELRKKAVKHAWIGTATFIGLYLLLILIVILLLF